MSNMSYCRFQNTASDLRDCVENIRSLDPAADGMNDRDEREARGTLITLAALLLEELGIDNPADEHAIEDAIFSLDNSTEFECEE